jgi:hypothetical protein
MKFGVLEMCLQIVPAGCSTGRMTDLVRIAETATKQAERVKQTSKQGGILAGAFLLLVAAGAVPIALAYFHVSDLVVAAALLLPGAVLVMTMMIVRETLRTKQLVLLGSEKVIMEAFRQGLVGTREHVLTGDPAPKTLEDMKPELAKVPLDPHHQGAH